MYNMCIGRFSLPPYWNLNPRINRVETGLPPFIAGFKAGIPLTTDTAQRSADGETELTTAKSDGRPSRSTT